MKKYGYVGVRIDGVGKFGAWLERNMKEARLTCPMLAEKLQVTRQRIALHLKKQTCVDFPNVVAYCWVFGMKDDPLEIYKLVEEDWA